METFHAFILALVQGATEFLPVSSSAHLILVPKFFDWPDQGVAFDAFISLGTLLAVIAYFRRDLAAIFYHWFAQFRRERPADPGQYARLGNLLILATIPAVVVGFFLADYVDDYLRSPRLIAITSLVFGLLLGAADWFGRKRLTLAQTGWRAALVYGLAQALSLIPGVSRSGITMTAGLAMGFDRQAAARFSFLMSIPITVAAGTLASVKMLASDAPLDWAALGTGFVASAVAGYLCIKYFLHFLNRYGMWPHVVYRILLSALLLAVFA
ncbi:MAG: undecaprenyl-diphosphate phosphatase [Cardiobacteriaceae bacterium]|nr:undecaprenyl-diphosphate phosphatase [Cardiobacteriaceae bacterium]